jgi:methylase of polypeptide subunit release factors
MTIAAPTSKSEMPIRAQVLTGSRETVGKRALRTFVHFFAYHLFLSRRRECRVKVAGFSLEVPPTVFHPRVFRTSEFFATFVLGLDLTGKRVADVGTGSGILALAAARAGASEVVALDVNPAAVGAAQRNATSNGLGDRITGMQSELLAALPPEPAFDVIISSVPHFPGKARDLADRGWHAGPDYRDVIDLFSQAGQRLTSTGVMYHKLSVHSDITRFGELISAAGFEARLVAEESIWIDRFFIYELRRPEGA